MAEIRWTQEAIYWLKEIHQYIVADNPVAAQRVVQSIYEKVQILRRLPEMGYRYQRYPDLNVRILLYGHYRIAYWIKDNGGIDILGIFHGALDIDRYLSGGSGVA
jgi:plasmid stabilization system protein ParE